jgi:hypothetical protein
MLNVVAHNCCPSYMGDIREAGINRRIMVLAKNKDLLKTN